MLIDAYEHEHVPRLSAATPQHVVDFMLDWSPLRRSAASSGAGLA
jgi:hypothetical protein